MSDILRFAWPTMTFDQLRFLLRERGLLVALDDGHLRLTGHTPLATPDLLQDLKHYRGDFLYHLEGGTEPPPLPLAAPDWRHYVFRYKVKPGEPRWYGVCEHFADPEKDFRFHAHEWRWAGEPPDTARPMPPPRAWQRLILKLGERSAS